MSDFEKIKLIAKQLQFFIDEGIVNENDCGSVLEEIYSVMEILEDCNQELKGVFSKEMKALEEVVKTDEH